MTITITKRTARNVCYQYENRDGVLQKCSMLHAKFAAWIAKCPSYVVIDKAA